MLKKQWHCSKRWVNKHPLTNFIATYFALKWCKSVSFQKFYRHTHFKLSIPNVKLTSKKLRLIWISYNFVVSFSSSFFILLRLISLHTLTLLTKIKSNMCFDDTDRMSKALKNFQTVPFCFYLWQETKIQDLTLYDKSIHTENILL